MYLGQNQLVVSEMKDKRRKANKNINKGVEEEEMAISKKIVKRNNVSENYDVTNLQDSL